MTEEIDPALGRRAATTPMLAVFARPDAAECDHHRAERRAV
jgi:hypothetical protein